MLAQVGAPQTSAQCAPRGGFSQRGDQGLPLVTWGTWLEQQQSIDVKNTNITMHRNKKCMCKVEIIFQRITNGLIVKTTVLLNVRWYLRSENVNVCIPTCVYACFDAKCM